MHKDKNVNMPDLPTTVMGGSHAKLMAGIMQTDNTMRSSLMGL